MNKNDGGTKVKNLLYGFRGFFFKHDATYDSNSLKVDGLSVSKSISISSGFESRNDGSLD